MSFASKLKMESVGMLLTVVFYAIVGIIFLALLPFVFAPHIGLIGIFSLIAAYGVFKKRNWTIWFIIILFFVATTFSAFMLYGYLLKDYLLGASMLAYLILTWIFTAYTAARRKNLES